MKKREIDIFAVMLGLIIGGIFGFFIGSRINPEDTKEVIDDTPIYGNVYLLQIMKSDDFNSIKNILNGTDITYEVINDNGMYYAYSSISTDDAILEAQKAELISIGLNPVIKSQYILDWPEKYRNDDKKYNFYKDIVSYLLDSINGEVYVIGDKYFSDPVNLQLLSNVALLKSIRSKDIKLQLQLETYKILYEEFN